MRQKKQRLRWKRSPAETGLALIAAPPRGYVLHDGKTTYAAVYANRVGFSFRYEGWYWVAPANPGVPYRNTYTTIEQDIETAKARAEEYVRQRLEEFAP